MRDLLRVIALTTLVAAFCVAAAAAQETDRVRVGGSNTTAITENSLITLFCSRLTMPSVASSRKVILFARKCA